VELRHATEEKDGIAREIELVKSKQEEMRIDYEKMNALNDTKIEEMKSIIEERSMKGS